MSVVRWERPIDVANERMVLDAIRQHLPFDRAMKLADQLSLDYAILRGDSIVAYCEIKCRPTLRFGQGDGYYISMLKLNAAALHRITSALRSFLVVRFAAGDIHYVELTTASRVVWHGRADRPDDPMAYEPCGVIAWSRWKPLARIEGELII